MRSIHQALESIKHLKQVGIDKTSTCHVIQTLEYPVHLELVCSFQAELVIAASLTCSIQMKWNQCRCENSWETEADEPPTMKQRENTSLHNPLSIHIQ